MVVFVYIWMPNFGRFGHASMELSNGTYISWWPPYHFISEDLGEDEELEGGPPTYTLEITKNLDEDAMEEWWRNWYVTGHYEGVNFNCCWAVYKCLKTGGAPPSTTVVWRPETLRRYLVRWLRGASPFGTYFNLPWFD